VSFDIKVQSWWCYSSLSTVLTSADSWYILLDGFLGTSSLNSETDFVQIFKDRKFTSTFVESVKNENAWFIFKKMEGVSDMKYFITGLIIYNTWPPPAMGFVPIIGMFYLIKILFWHLFVCYFRDLLQQCIIYVSFYVNDLSTVPHVPKIIFQVSGNLITI
jgi:hypothetical protein